MAGYKPGQGTNSAFLDIWGALKKAGHLDGLTGEDELRRVVEIIEASKKLPQE